MPDQDETMPDQFPREPLGLYAEGLNRPEFPCKTVRRLIDQLAANPASVDRAGRFMILWHIKRDRCPDCVRHAERVIACRN